MLSDIKQAEEFEALPRSLRGIVFYSEGPADWPHLSALVKALVNDHKFPVVYLTSDQRDPGLRLQSPLMRTFQIGKGGVRANLFSRLSADIMVMTTPDLGNLSLGRSPNCGHYVYVFHSPVSTHMIYRPKAFDNYDTVFSVGPHHDAEIRRHEELIGGKVKDLVPFGYSRLDDILDTQPNVPSKPEGEPLSVVVAPSWGPSGIFETIGEEVVQTLLNAGFQVTARPHPQTRRLTPKVITELAEHFGGEQRFSLDEDIAGSEALQTADILISDWSGAALDYAFSRLKPVVFIDTPPKVNNPDHRDLDIEPIEVSIRSEIGSVVSPDDLLNLPEVVANLADDPDAYASKISDIRENTIYNLGESGRVGATYLLEKLQSMTLPEPTVSPNVSSQLSEIIARQLDHQQDAELDPTTFDTAAFIKGLFASTDAFDEEALRSLEALCRKIDVAGRVWARYDLSLKKPAEKTELSSASLLALGMLWLRAAQALGPDDQDLALKFVNSADRCIEKVAKMDQKVRLDFFEQLIATTLAAVRTSA